MPQTPIARDSHVPRRAPTRSHRRWGLLFCLVLLAWTPAAPVVTIWLAGDSTMAHKLDEKRPETGWGEMLPSLLDSTVRVENRAMNGRSTKSFIAEGRWT